MAMNVDGLTGQGQPAEPRQVHILRSSESAAHTSRSAQQSPPPEAQDVNTEKVLAELRRVSRIFNRRLKFSYNDELEQLVVKVVDSDSDKVIKEIPPRELQRLYARIREAIGLLVDEQR